MEWLVWMVAVAILGLAAVAASGRFGEFPATVTDTPQPHVPDGRLSGIDLRALRFAVVPRGYSMQQVDDLLDRLSRQLDQEPVEPAAAPVSEADPAPAPDWGPARRWTEAEPDEPADAEPQPPLRDEPEPTEEPIAAAQPTATLRGEPEPKTVPRPEPEPAPASEPDAQGAHDNLEAEIAEIGAGQTAVTDYAAALDDLVSKYSFRKVEHWYELPGFYIPAPSAASPADPADAPAPRPESTPEPT